MARTKKITVADVEYVAFSLAKELMEWDEPIPDFETRFPEKLESAIATPFQSFDKKDLYRRLQGKASALFYFMIKDHPFQNGNKRIAVTTLFFYLMQNNKWLRVTSNDVYKFAKAVAESDPKDKDATLKMIEFFIASNLIPSIVDQD